MKLAENSDFLNMANLTKDQQFDGDGNSFGVRKRPANIDKVQPSNIYTVNTNDGTLVNIT